MERIVQLEQNGRRFIFRVDYRGDVSFWRVESGGKTYLSPMTVHGDEQEGFFRSLAASAVQLGRL